MKNSIFVYVNSDSIKIIYENLSKSINYFDQGIHNVNSDILALLIKEYLVQNSLSDSPIILVPGSEYVVITEKIVVSTKTSAKLESEYENSNINIIKRESFDKGFIFSKTITYICNGKTYSRFESIPLLYKYFTNYKTIGFDMVFMTSLLSSLEKYEIDVASIVSFELMNSCSPSSETCTDRHILISLLENKSIVSVVSNGVIHKNIIYPSGLKKIQEKISNSFDVSLQTASILAKQYGYTFLPKEYLNYAIDIPVYSNLVQSVELTDLTYCIRESLKDLYTSVINCLATIMSDYEINSVFICESSTQIKGMETLLELMLNKNIEFNSSVRHEYPVVHNNYNRLYKVDIETNKILVIPTIDVTEKTQESPALLDRLTNIFNSRIKPFLLESEI